MKRNRSKAMEIFKVKRNILCKIPNAEKVEIGVEKISDEEFEALIRVKIPARNDLIAFKKGNDSFLCLQKSHEEILKQINNFSSKRFNSSVSIAS